MNELIMPTPDDMHLHVRDGARLWSVVPHTAAQFGRAIIMPNLAPKHITTKSEMLEYRDKILDAAKASNSSFQPLMTVSLSKEQTCHDLDEAMRCEDGRAAKLYAGHTTNSEGVTDVRALFPFLEVLQLRDKPLLIHGEAGVTVDVFDREKKFYENEMLMILANFPKLRIVCEHITTKVAVDFVTAARENVVATITPQHLLASRNDMLGRGGIRPHYYCMPILKREEDRMALLEAATSGDPKFFLGTDSAPHPRFGEDGKAKESGCGCAGSYTAPHALSLYAEAFASEEKLHMLPDFASRFGCEFYHLPANKGQVVISEEEWKLPREYEFGDETVVPFRYEKPLQWKARRVG